MSDTMIRIKNSTLWKLQQVKKDMGVKSYDKVISQLLDTSIAVKELSDKFEKDQAERSNGPISSAEVPKGSDRFIVPDMTPITIKDSR